MRRPILSNRPSIVACGAVALGVSATLVFAAAAPAVAATQPAPPAATAIIGADPAVAADSQPVVVPFSDVLTATIGGPGDGFVLETGQAGLTWDSSIAGKTRLKTIGAGWTWGAPYVDFTDGTAVYLPGHGELQADPESKNGLSDGTLNVLFQQQSGWLPARPGVVDGQRYDATLQNLGTGVTDYFDSSGNSIATVGPDGRTDRSFDGVKLTAVTDPAGHNSSVTYPGLPRVKHPDGSVATVVLFEQGGVSGIQVFNLDSTPRFLSQIAYETDAAGAGHITSVTSVAPETGETLSALGLLWADGAPGGVSAAVLDGNIVYQR